MVFAYYNRLNKKQKSVYRQSDNVTAIQLPATTTLQPLVLDLVTSLEQQDKARTQTVCQRLANVITDSLEVRALKIKVMAVRPCDDEEELHGFYLPTEGRKMPLITVWMRTAKRKQVVAFRTFLRTLLHEICHHLDYELLCLEESWHTEGFYKRESSLFYQLVPILEKETG